MDYMAPSELTPDQRAHDEATRIVAQLEADRRRVGMKPTEMYEIAESSGVVELRAELDRRLKVLSASA
jgi:hypothetical protein